MANKHRVVKLKDLKTHYFVRKGINQDHVLMLAELYEAAMLESNSDSVAASRAVAAIQVTEEMELVDGRHRKEAMELAQITDARVEVLPPMTTAELVVAAAKANYGGALPPTREDMIFTIEQLLTRHGMTAKAVEEHMTMLPKSVVRKYVNMANKRINEIRLKLAITDMANGLTLQQAARQHSLKPEAVQLALEGKKPKSKTGAAQLSSALTAYTKGYSGQVSRIINKSIEEFRNGEISEDTVQTALNHQGHLMRRMFLRLEDWQRRLKAAKVGEAMPDVDSDTDHVITYDKRTN